MIDLSAFKESSDEDYLIDTWMEALLPESDDPLRGGRFHFQTMERAMLVKFYQDDAQQEACRNSRKFHKEVTRVIDRKSSPVAV